MCILLIACLLNFVRLSVENKQCYFEKLMKQIKNNLSKEAIITKIRSLHVVF